MAQPTWQEIFEQVNPGIVDTLEEFASGYEGVDMGVPELSKAQQDALRNRGINPKYFRPRLGGAFKDFEFSGDFGQDLRSMNEIFQSAGGQNMQGAAKSPQNIAGQDYQRALDSLFQEYPDAPTQSGDFYLNVGIPYFRQGDQTGWSEGGEIGDFSGFHINDDTDSFGNFLSQIGNSPMGNVLDFVLPGPSIPGTGEMGESIGIPGFSYGDIISDLGKALGGGGTFGGPPARPQDGFESIYDPTVEGDIPGVPGMDLPGPGGIWDLIDIDIPGGGGQRDDTPVDITLPEQPDNVPSFPAEPDVPRGTSPEGPTLPEEDIPTDEPWDTLPPWDEILTGPTDPIEEDRPGQRPEPQPPSGGILDLPTLELPGGDGGSMSDWRDWLPGGAGNTDIDWSNILNPDFRIEDLIGDIANTATGGSSNVNIDFGNLADVLGTIAGGWLGYDQSRQDPQYPTLRDLYGGEYEGPMEGLRDQILNQTIGAPNQWVADLPPEMQRAIGELTGLSTGRGRNIADQQILQGREGSAGLQGIGGYTDFLRETGGPEFEYDQDVFDQTMANLMPGVAGSYVDQTRDIVRNLNENILPGIDLGAAATGNMASSRTGIERGVAQRGAADRMADIESQLIQNAINQAQGAAMGAGGQTLGANMGTQGNILGGYGSAARYGLPGYGDAFGTMTDASRLGLVGSGIQRDYNQAVLDAPRDLLGWQIPLINATTPAGVGNIGSPYTAPSALEGIMQGIDLGTGVSDVFQNMMGGWSTRGNAA